MIRRANDDILFHPHVLIRRILRVIIAALPQALLRYDNALFAARCAFLPIHDRPLNVMPDPRFGMRAAFCSAHRADVIPHPTPARSVRLSGVFFIFNEVMEGLFGERSVRRIVIERNIDAGRIRRQRVALPEHDDLVPDLFPRFQHAIRGNAYPLHGDGRSLSRRERIADRITLFTIIHD